MLGRFTIVERILGLSFVVKSDGFAVGQIDGREVLVNLHEMSNFGHTVIANAGSLHEADGRLTAIAEGVLRGVTMLPTGCQCVVRTCGEPVVYISTAGTMVCVIGSEDDTIPWSVNIGLDGCHGWVHGKTVVALSRSGYDETGCVPTIVGRTGVVDGSEFDNKVILTFGVTDRRGVKCTEAMSSLWDDFGLVLSCVLDDLSSSIGDCGELCKLWCSVRKESADRYEWIGTDCKARYNYHGTVRL